MVISALSGGSNDHATQTLSRRNARAISEGAQGADQGRGRADENAASNRRTEAEVKPENRVEATPKVAETPIGPAKTSPGANAESMVLAADSNNSTAETAPETETGAAAESGQDAGTEAKPAPAAEAEESETAESAKEVLFGSDGADPEPEASSTPPRASEQKEQNPADAPSSESTETRAGSETQSQAGPSAAAESAEARRFSSAQNSEPEGKMIDTGTVFDAFGSFASNSSLQGMMSALADVTATAENWGESQYDALFASATEKNDEPSDANTEIKEENAGGDDDKLAGRLASERANEAYAAQSSMMEVKNANAPGFT